MFAPKRRVPRTNAPGNVILVLSSDEEESPSQRRHARRVPGPPDAEPQTPAGSDLSQGLPGSGTSNVIEISDEDEQGSVEKISPPQLLDNAKTHHLSQSSTEKGACLPSNCNQNATLQEFRVSHLDPMVLRVSSDRNVLDGPYSTIESSPLPACPLEEFNSSQAPSDARKDGDMAILVNNSGVIPTDKIEKTELSPMMPTNQPYPIKTNDQRVLFEGSKFVSHTASNVVSDQNNTKSTASLSNKRRLSSTELNSNISPTDKPIDKSHSSESNAQPKTNVPEDPNISNATLNNKHQTSIVKSPSLQEIILMLNKCSKELVEDHAFVVPHLLIDARKGCQYPERAHLLDNSPSHITGGNHSRVLPQLVDKHSPFRNMKRNTSISGNGLRLECVNHPQITLRKFKIKQITTPIKTYSPEVAVPPYQCYFTMKRNVLATDDTKLRYHHYFGENDTGKEFALKDTFDHDLTSSLPKANRQLENGKRWKPYLAKLLSGLDCSELNIFQFLVADLKPLHECLGSTWSLSEIEETRSRILPKDMGLDECQINILKKKLPPLQCRQITTAYLISKSFYDIAKTSPWHLVKTSADFLCEQTKSALQPLGTYTDLGCLICFLHDCPGHGQTDSNSAKLRIHGPGFFISSENELQNLSLSVPQSKTGDPFRDGEFCSSQCHWKVANTTQPETIWSEKQITILQDLLPSLDTKRSSCLLTSVISKTCHEIHCKLSSASIQTYLTTCTFNGGNPFNVRSSDVSKHPQRIKYFYEHTKTSKHDKRASYKPCNHPGSCNGDNCICVANDVSCEKGCFCSGDCSRKFRGCSCSRTSKKTCVFESCECVHLNRECDPDTCGSCGVHILLDPVHKRQGSATAGLCKNASLQRDRPKRTFLGRSLLQNTNFYGLFAGVDLEQGDYIGEYRAEIVTHLESERRGGISDARESSFLFVLNQDQTLDARRGGNKTRFINHSKKHLKNCYARVLLVNGSHRIGLFAQKKIPALEELFFDYGYAINHAKQFVAEEIKAPHPARPRGRPLLKKNFSGKGTTTRKKREPKTSQPDLSINKTTSARALAKKEEKQGDGGEIEEEAEPSGPELADTDRSFDNRLVEDEDTGDEPIVIRRRRRRFGGRRR